MVYKNVFIKDFRTWNGYSTLLNHKIDPETGTISYTEKRRGLTIQVDRKNPQNIIEGHVIGDLVVLAHVAFLTNIKEQKPKVIGEYKYTKYFPNIKHQKLLFKTTTNVKTGEYVEEQVISDSFSLCGYEESEFKYKEQAIKLLESDRETLLLKPFNIEEYSFSNGNLSFKSYSSELFKTTTHEYYPNVEIVYARIASFESGYPESYRTDEAIESRKIYSEPLSLKMFAVSKGAKWQSNRDESEDFSYSAYGRHRSKNYESRYFKDEELYPEYVEEYKEYLSAFKPTLIDDPTKRFKRVERTEYIDKKLGIHTVFTEKYNVSITYDPDTRSEKIKYTEREESTDLVQIDLDKINKLLLKEWEEQLL